MNRDKTYYAEKIVELEEVSVKIEALVYELEQLSLAVSKTRAEGILDSYCIPYLKGVVGLAPTIMMNLTDAIDALKREMEGME